MIVFRVEVELMWMFHRLREVSRAVIQVTSSVETARAASESVHREEKKSWIFSLLLLIAIVLLIVSQAPPWLCRALESIPMQDLL